MFASILLLASASLVYSASSEAQQVRSFPAPPVRAYGAVVMDATTGQLLMGVNAHRRLPMASTTKIMTALLALQMGKLTDRITVPAGSFNFEPDATVMGLRPGEVVTLNDLLYGLLLPSGADAADAIAIHYAGSEARFVDLMNREAARLGMRDTHYATPHGLPAPDQYSSAYDLALLARYVSIMPSFMRIVGSRSYTWNGHVLTNINHVILWYPGADGIKPGFTDEAGLCQVLDVHRDGRHIVAAVLHTPDMVIDARNLLNYGLQDFSWVHSALHGDKTTLEQNGSDRDGRYVYFPGSGHYIRGQFWQAFAARGGLSTLGFPRSEQIIEGARHVQFFQNGELATERSGRIVRLPLGLAVPSSAPGPPPAPPDTGQTPIVGTLPPSTITAVPVRYAIPNVFTHFYRSHPGLLGASSTAAQWSHGFLTQIFAYGALAYDGSTHAVMLLPVGDRWLASRHFLPEYPGTVYPPGYAPLSVLHEIGWLSGM
jgi:D-alanyl-D-alanine carboxypeptidase (penicillin-binding protein 5/6)